MRFVQGIDYGPRRSTTGFAIHMAEGGDGTVRWLAQRPGESEAAWKKRVRGVSANFVILSTGEVVQMVAWAHASGSMNPRDRGPLAGFYRHEILVDVLGDAWRDPNAHSLSVEVTGFRAQGPTAAQVEALVSLVGIARRRYPTLAGAYGHADQTSTKGCPGLAASMREAWVRIGHGRFTEDDMATPTYATPLFSAIFPKGTPVFEDATGPQARTLAVDTRLTVRAADADPPTRLLVSGGNAGEMDWVPASGYRDRVNLGG